MDSYNNDSQLSAIVSTVAPQQTSRVLTKNITETYVIPESFGAKANDPKFDNSKALNSAFATGKDVYSTPDKTYYVTKNLKTTGQRLIGGWKIHSKKKHQEQESGNKQ